MLVPALVPVGPLPQRLLPPHRLTAMQKRADLLPPIPQIIPLPRLSNNDQVKVGLLVRRSLRERTVHHGSTHSGVRSRPRGGSGGHLLSGNSHRLSHLPSHVSQRSTWIAAWSQSCRRRQLGSGPIGLQFGLQLTAVRGRPGRTGLATLVQAEPIRTTATPAANAVDHTARKYSNVPAQPRAVTIGRTLS